MNIRNLKNEQLKRTPASTMSTHTSGPSSTTASTKSNIFFPSQPCASSQPVLSSHAKKLSSSSSSSITSTSSIGSIVNGASSSQQPLMNPFEETNRFRLEQSVLSPNLFHVANTSTPERDTNSLWNIDQRAVLYPADIPIDESSLMAQYAYDYKLSKQVIPAVEAFWTQNKIIIESPLTGTTGSALRAKFAPMFNNNSNCNSSTKKNRLGKANSVNSPLTNELYNNLSSKKVNNQIDIVVNKTSKLNSNSSGLNIHSSSSTVTTTYITKSSRRDQISQTNLCIPVDFDLSKIPELKQFMLNDEQITESPFKSKDSQLNNSIRKKLFDHNSEDSSTATTTTTTPIQSVLLTKLKSADLSALKQQTQSNEQPKRISQLPKPEIYSSSDNDNLNTQKQPRTLASSSSSNTDDCWNDSFEFDDHQFASSPKYEKFSHIIHDIGGDIGDDDLNDSVFLTQHHKTPPDLSPLPMDGERFTDNSKHTNQINHDINSPLNYESRMHFNFDNVQSASKKTDKAALSSPNLSPIRQQHTAESTNCTLKTSNTKSQNRLNKIKSDNNLVNMSALSQAGAKSIIFMDCGNGVTATTDQHDESKENKSFSESISENEHHNHYKREEFYKQNSFNELEANNNETYREESLKNANKLASTNNIDINKPSMKTQKSSGSTSSSSGNSKPFLLTTMNSMMSETTTNTFNQDSQDTGYQTNSVVNGSNSTANTNMMMNTNTCNPSMMIMDMTNNQNELTNNYLFLSSTSLSTSQPKFKTNLTTNTVTSSTPMNIEDDTTNSTSNNEKENHFKATYKRPSLDFKLQAHSSASTTSKNLKIKKNSVSLNSLENIKPLEASTPEILKFSFNSNSLFKPIVSARSSKTSNELIKTSTTNTTNRKVNFVKSKTFNLTRLNANYLNTNKILVKEPVVLLATNSMTNQNVNNNNNNNNDNDVSMLSNSSNLVFFSESINENTNSTTSNSDLIKKKNQLDSLYVEQSILMSKISPSNSELFI